MNEGAFELPEGAGPHPGLRADEPRYAPGPFIDRTLHVLEGDLPGDAPLALVVHRAPFPPGKTLRELVLSRLTRERDQLAGHAVIEEREAAWAGAPALEISSHYRQGDEVIYQRQAHLMLGDTWLYFALSAPYAEREACDARLDTLRASLRLRSED
jgi:hypothetical protein